MIIFTAVKYCCILHGRVCVMAFVFRFNACDGLITATSPYRLYIYSKIKDDKEGLELSACQNNGLLCPTLIITTLVLTGRSLKLAE